MNKMNKNLKYISAAITAALTLIILSACGSSILPAPGQPVAAEPDAHNPNRIEISWMAVDGADIYYVYRADSEDGTYALNGFSVTGTEVENTDGADELYYRYIESFDTGDGGAYWYKVTAASNSDVTDAGESAMSPFVRAETYSGTWSAAKELGAAGQLKLVADNSTLYAVYADYDGTDHIFMQTYAEDDTSDADDPPMIWTPNTDSPGETDGRVNNPYSVFISGGELYAAFRDSDEAGELTLKTYHNSGTDDLPSFAWEAVGAAGFNGGGTAVVTDIAAVTSGFGGTIYTAFLSQTEDLTTIEVPEDADADEGSLWKYNTTTETWFKSDISSDFPVDMAGVKMLNHNNNLYLGYKDLVTPGIYLRAYDDGVTALQAGGLVEAAAIDDGNAVFVSGGGSLYAVYIKSGDGSFNVEQLIDDVWTPLTNNTGKPDTAAAMGYGTLAAHWFNGYLYVFYVDTSTAGENRGWVKYYDADDGWQNAQQNGGSAITGSDIVGTGLAAFQLASSGNRLFAGWVENDKAYVKILE